jgi:hypothetical protein
MDFVRDIPSEKSGDCAKYVWAGCLLILSALLYRQAWAEEPPQTVVIADPYIELHTGPGRGYPVFHVEERGATIAILMRKTNWFKVRTAREIEGWVDRAQLERTLDPAGERMQVQEATAEEYERRRWEAGVMTGDFDGASEISMYGAYALTNGLHAELSLTQVLGDFSESLLVNADLLAQPFPHWRFSPYLALGTGVIDTKPRTILVQTQDRNDRMSHVGIGVRTYLSRRFMLRMEYRNHVIFTSRDDNEEIDEWKIGFGVFF